MDTFVGVALLLLTNDKDLGLLWHHPRGYRKRSLITVRWGWKFRLITWSPLILQDEDGGLVTGWHRWSPSFLITLLWYYPLWELRYLTRVSQKCKLWPNHTDKSWVGSLCLHFWTKVTGFQELKDCTWNSHIQPKNRRLNKPQKWFIINLQLSSSIKRSISGPNRKFQIIHPYWSRKESVVLYKVENRVWHKCIFQRTKPKVNIHLTGRCFQWFLDHNWFLITLKWERIPKYKVVQVLFSFIWKPLRSDSGNSVRLYFSGFQNDYRWWLQPWN